jgi:hypothetical protein
MAVFCLKKNKGPDGCRARKVETLLIMVKKKITQTAEEINTEEATIERQEIPYFQVANSIIDDEDNLTAYEMLVYFVLCRYGNNGKAAFPSYATIQKKAAISRASVARALTGLIEKGYIVKKNRTGNSNIYSVIWEPVSHRDGVVSHRDGVPVSQGDTIKKDLLIKKNIESTPQPQKAPALALDSSKEEKPQSEVNQAIGHYLELFEKATGEKAIITTGKDHQLIKTILTTYGIEKTLALLDAYFETADNFVIERGYPLGIFRSNLTGLLVKYKEQQKIKKKEEAQKEEQRRRQELESLKEEQFEKARAEWEALPEVEKVRSKLKEKREFIYGPMREHFNKYAEQGDEEALARLQKYARQEGELIKQLRAAGGIEADKLWNELKKEEERIARYYRSNGLRMIES